jgi:hypothetical protein
MAEVREGGPMTFEQLFRGCIALARAQRHLNNRAVVFIPTGAYLHLGSPEHEAFFILEQLLVELETELDARSNRKRTRRTS